jgi:hypothetical protein
LGIGVTRNPWKTSRGFHLQRHTSTASHTLAPPAPLSNHLSSSAQLLWHCGLELGMSLQDPHREILVITRHTSMWTCYETLSMSSPLLSALTSSFPNLNLQSRPNCGSNISEISGVAKKRFFSEQAFQD